LCSAWLASKQQQQAFAGEASALPFTLLPDQNINCLWGAIGMFLHLLQGLALQEREVSHSSLPPTCTSWSSGAVLAAQQMTTVKLFP
jgi:hypothetical protein